MTKLLEIIKSNQKVCNVHADRLQKSLDALDDYLPFKPQQLEQFTVIELALLDMLTTRFANLQDTIGTKIFPMILRANEENIENKSFIDILNRLEKMELLPSTQYWRNMREIRNNITHEYPDDPELRIKHLNIATDYIRELLKYWSKLNQYVDNLIVQ